MYSVIITSYECNGKGSAFLKETLESVFSQTYKPIQCIVSDHSKNNDIETMVGLLDTKCVNFKYVRYSENYGNPCHNWNHGLQYATGDYIHCLAMDDKLANDNCIEEIMNVIKKSNSNWFACSHILSTTGEKYVPKWHSRILYGENLLSGPSAVIIDKKIKDVILDPQFIWFLDVDWYYRLFLTAGEPTIIDCVLFINRIHSDQLTNTVCHIKLRDSEYLKLIEKYGNPLPLAKSFKYHAWNNVHRF